MSLFGGNTAFGANKTAAAGGTTAGAGFGAAGTGTSTTAPKIAFGSGTWGAKSFTPAASLVKPGDKLRDLATGANGEVKEQTVEAARNLVELSKIVAKYDGHTHGIEGAEVFETSVREIEDYLNRAVKHTIISLAGEIDHGKGQITAFREDLDRSKTDFRDARQGASGSSSRLLTRFRDQMIQRKAILSSAIHDFETNLAQESEPPTSQMMVEVLQQQHEAILRCAARIARLKEKATNVQKQVQDWRQRRADRWDMDVTDELDAAEVRTVVQSVRAKYQDFVTSRRRDLEKKETDVSKFADAQKAGTGGFRFGTAAAGTAAARPGTGTTFGAAGAGTAGAGGGSQFGALGAGAVRVAPPP
jgi:uncharacterized spore protein YtfJ